MDWITIRQLAFSCCYYFPHACLLACCVCSFVYTLVSALCHLLLRMSSVLMLHFITADGVQNVRACLSTSGYTHTWRLRCVTITEAVSLQLTQSARIYFCDSFFSIPYYPVNSHILLLRSHLPSRKPSFIYHSCGLFFPVPYFSPFPSIPPILCSSPSSLLSWYPWPLWWCICPFWHVTVSLILSSGVLCKGREMWPCHTQQKDCVCVCVCVNLCIFWCRWMISYVHFAFVRWSLPNTLTRFLMSNLNQSLLMANLFMIKNYI